MLPSAEFFHNKLFSNKNNLFDHDQDRHSVRSDLGPGKMLKRISAEDESRRY